MAYIGNNLTVQQYAPTIQYFSGDGSTTAFTLPIAVVSAAQIIVSVANVVQNPSSAYTVSGSTLTFTSAPPTGTNNIWVEYTSLQTNTVQPGAGTVNASSIASNYALWNLSSSNISYSAGNVGVGISTPSYALDVKRSGTSVGPTAHFGNDDDDLFVINSNNSIAKISGDSSGNYAWGFSSYNNYIAGYTGGTERMRIDSSGRVGIGTNSPAWPLTIINNGSVTDVTAYFQNSSTHSAVNNLYSVIPSQAFNTSSAHFAGQTAGTNTWLLYGNGTTSYSSDENLKKNIVTTRDGYIDDVAKLRVVKYQWKINPDDSPVELGLIAQEVAEVFPGLVKDKAPINPDGTRGESHKVILGSVFQPILIKCVQELYEKIQSLEAEVAALKAGK